MPGARPNLDELESARADPRPAAGTPLYVHLPFCTAKCHYCDFFSVPAEGQDLDGTLEAILSEAEDRAPRDPRTVYLGGGTPSLFSVEQLRRLLDRLEALTGFRSSALEVTAECNPESLDEDKARALLDLGVTRLSIGFQSLHPEVLELFGRVHQVDDSFRAFEAARKAGVGELSVDLIFAVPGQETATWEADLARVLDLGPEHLSAYNLTFEEETLFKRWLDQGRIVQEGEERELELFLTTRRVLAERGYGAYEISNFSLSGYECSHNVNYWRNGPYLGIGPSAVSKIGRRRSGNLKPLGEYRRRARAGRSARAWSEEPTFSARLGETWWLGLRLAAGISAVEALERADPAQDDPADLQAVEGASQAADAIVQRLTDQGLIEELGGRYHLTERGLPLADWVGKEFLALGLGDEAAARARPEPVG